MATVTLGLRSSGSYGSSHQHQLLQNGVPVMARKQMKMMKERDKLLYWIFKRFAPRRRFAMLLLSIVSVLIFVLVPFVDKGEDAYERVRLNNRFSRPGFLPINQAQNNDYVPYSELSAMRWRDLAQPRPSPVYFKGYTLPPGNPCKNFKLPPPPSDKKRTGPRPCPVCYLPVEEAIASMPNASSFSPVIQNLTYIHEENSVKSEFGGSDFGGYPSLKQRNDSYDIRESMSIHCGFVRGVKPGHGTGFEIDDSDRLEMETCKGVVVASAIFGVYDILQQPTNISEYAKKNACFYMFVDEETDEFLRNNTVFDSSKRIELWRIVVVHNLPYTDPRRNGKVPKLLLHRLFPNARYSLWIDGKLQLVVDPYQILERFLWRENASFAISRHYKRFDTFIEAEANKAAGKYDNSSIDFQIQFYKNEGLTPYSTAKLPITSDVPEGCVIIREHIPISNLFTCQWFHEVDRFTSRDQISFSTVRDKITAKTNWNVHMFLDCERRNFVVQGYHRDVLEHWAPPSPPPPPPPEISSQNINNPPRKIPAKHWRDGTSGLHRHRKVAAGNRHTS